MRGRSIYTRNAITALALSAAAALAIWAVAQEPAWRPVASYSTSLVGRTNAQIHNLELAVKAINGRTIPPGGEFSFNRTVGSWTAERGYVKAPVSFDGELIPAWGGGVCQASSTLYNAALLAGLDIAERHRHRFPAKYTPPGQDAAVAQYDIDLRIRNPYDWPVRIEAETAGDRVICRILSQTPPRGQITIEREITQLTAPGKVVRSGGTGSRLRIVNHGQPGLRVAVYRRVTVGARSTRSLVSEDTYQPMNVLVVSR